MFKIKKDYTLKRIVGTIGSIRVNRVLNFLRKQPD